MADPSQRHTLIVGAGLAGITTAYAMVRRGARVTIVDQEAGPGSGASFANGGMLTPSMADPWNAPGVWRDLLRWLGREDAPMLLRAHAIPGLALWGAQFLAASNRDHFERVTVLNARLGLFSIRVMEAWAKDITLDYDPSVRGTMKIYRDQRAWLEGVAKAGAMERIGVSYEPMDAAQTVAFEPALAPIAGELAGAVRFPGDRSGNAHKFVLGLAQICEQLGVAFKWRVAATRLNVHGNRVSGVTLSDGAIIEADMVVLATGAHAADLARDVGVSLPIRPVKGYSISFPTAGVPDLPSIPIVDDALHAAITPLGTVVRVAGTAEFSGFDATIRPGRVENLRGLLRQLLPERAAMLEQAGGAPWAGLRPMHARGVPAIGRTRVTGLFVNAGHGHLGWTLAAGSAEALAQLALGETPNFDLAPFERG